MERIMTAKNDMTTQLQAFSAETIGFIVGEAVQDRDVTPAK
jgi:hypothetical protein